MSTRVIEVRIWGQLVGAVAPDPNLGTGALEREGRDDDVAAALKRRADGLVKFFDRRRERLVQAIAVGRLHDDGVDLRRIGRRAQQRPAGVAEVAGEQRPSLPPASSTSNKMLAEPRMCPASKKVTTTPVASVIDWP